MITGQNSMTLARRCGEKYVTIFKVNQLNQNRLYIFGWQKKELFRVINFELFINWHFYRVIYDNYWHMLDLRWIFPYLRVQITRASNYQTSCLVSVSWAELMGHGKVTPFLSGSQSKSYFLSRVAPQIMMMHILSDYFRRVGCIFFLLSFTCIKVWLHIVKAFSDIQTVKKVGGHL